MPLLALPLLALLALPLPLLALPLPLPLASPLVAAAAVPSASLPELMVAVAVLLFQIGAGLPIVATTLPLGLAFRGPRLG